MTTYTETDGTLGEGEFLASGHAGHDHDDHADHDHDHADHDHHHHDDRHEGGHCEDCQCEACQGAGLGNPVDTNVETADRDELLLDLFSGLGDLGQFVPPEVESIQPAYSSDTDGRTWLELLNG